MYVCVCVCGHVQPQDVSKPWQTPNVSVPVHAQLCYVIELGAGTCKITQDSIAAEALGHCDG